MLARDLLYQSAKKLSLAGSDAPRLNAELLLMHAWDCSRIELIGRSQQEIPVEIQGRFEALLGRRLKREPLAYILGEKEFWSRRFLVTPDVLIPRPETEHLIEAVLKYLPDHMAPYQFSDIGTGSGCIAVTLACEYPHAHVIATDISPAALAVAGENAALHGVTERMTFLAGNMLKPLLDQHCELDAVISNPPYVTLAEMAELDKELAFEPRQALTDEADGLSFLQNLTAGAPACLKDGGYLLLETGPCGLPEPPAELAMLEKLPDLAGLVRGAVYQRQG
ncbi:MAG TPA: peptide chain release factor N(5)-glutamine methyltransferase [Mariprofundaceae bacterium]|nr:peptide chain release factor N(5)-glutamine methyltransferase [Mariprofundaceae bacterium]